MWTQIIMIIFSLNLRCTFALPMWPFAIGALGNRISIFLPLCLSLLFLSLSALLSPPSDAHSESQKCRHINRFSVVYFVIELFWFDVVAGNAFCIHAFSLCLAVDHNFIRLSFCKTKIVKLLRLVPLCIVFSFAPFHRFLHLFTDIHYGHESQTKWRAIRGEKRHRPETHRDRVSEEGRAKPL